MVSKHFHSAGLMIGVALAWSAATSIAAPATQTITVREQLNQAYGRELVVYSFSARKRACAADSLQLVGPEGPVAVQLSGAEYWPGRTQYVKSAQLSFVVKDLKPLTSAPYTLSYGRKRADAVTADLQVKKAKGSVEITASQIGVRMLLGNGEVAAPAAMKDVPGPLVAMRLGNGAWSGGSALTGDAKVASWNAELTDAGPVFARVAVSYVFEDGNTVDLTATVIAGDNTVRWEMNSREDRPALGLEVRLPPVPGVTKAVLPRGYGQWSRADRTQDLTPGAEPFNFLSPDSSIVNAFPDCAPNIRLASATGGGTELQLRSRDPGVWSEPVAPLTYAGFKTWQLDDIPRMWEVWKRKRVPVSYAADGTVTLQANFAKGGRKWWTSTGVPTVGDELSRRKDLVLDWPSGSKRPHPRLFAGTAEFREAWARAATAPEFMKALTAGGARSAGIAVPVLLKPADQLKKAETEPAIKSLRDQLALMGDFDVMRGAIRTVTLYDVLIDSKALTPEDTALFRAQMAWLAYVMASPRCWSMESGYLSGNPNMSCSYTLSLGIIACALSDHPAAKAWAERATQWMDKWLTDEVGPNGEWMPEGSHYGYVSLEPMISYAIAARRAGYHDFSSDPRFKKVLLYFAKYNTPRDPQRKNCRGIGAYGRGHSGDRLAAFGIAAPFFKESDPAFSSALQWMWSENGYPYFMGDGRLGGLEPYYADRRLPSEAPTWSSEFFPNLGALLRAGFNTPHESYVNFLAATDSLRNLDIWVAGVGGISQWFGRGKPLSTCFTQTIGYNERHELLRDGVRLARNWGDPADSKAPFGHYTKTTFGTFAALRQADYVRSTFTNLRVDDRDWFPKDLPAYPRVAPAKGTELEWTRQLLFLKDADPAGPAYLVLRDTTAGGQPTAWQFWTLSEKVGAADEARNAAEFLADKPGPTVLPARALPAGDRYTALGQFGMDVDYYVASPAATPRHTLRWGGKWRVSEYQDLLHLQQPGDGSYYVVIYPRPRAEAAPTFTKLAGGAILKMTAAFGTDYAFLELGEAAVSAEGVSFKGTAGAAQQRPDATTLSLAAPGEVRFKEFGLAGPVAAALRVSTDKLELSLPADTAGGEFTLTAPGPWKLKDAPPGVKLAAVSAGAQRVTVPKGVARVLLTK